LWRCGFFSKVIISQKPDKRKQNAKKHTFTQSRENLFVVRDGSLFCGRFIYIK